MQLQLPYEKLENDLPIDAEVFPNDSLGIGKIHVADWHPALSIIGVMHMGSFRVIGVHEQPFRIDPQGPLPNDILVGVNPGTAARVPYPLATHLSICMRGLIMVFTPIVHGLNTMLPPGREHEFTGKDWQGRGVAPRNSDNSCARAPRSPRRHAQCADR